MLTRYTTTDDGSHHKIADIYTTEEHGITPDKLDGDALKVARRLEQHGYEAYVVGGAVRDLLLGKRPKDFDIATDALPKEVRKLFRNSRIIGRRFRLVHVQFGSKIIEVSTFRSDSPGGKNNVYGALEEDVRRRDFSLNALYYSPKSGYILDFVGAFGDIKACRMRSLLSHDVTFKEDPVRLLRAVKYSVITGFSIPRKLKMAIKKDAEELKKSSPSRLTEELFKILHSGYCAEILRALQEHTLLEYLLPQIDLALKEKGSQNFQKHFFKNLEALDAFVREYPDPPRDKSLSFLFLAFLPEIPGDSGTVELPESLFSQAKILLAPLTPPNREIWRAVDILLAELGFSKKVQQTRKKRRPPRKPEGPPMNT
ncbi:MAG: polynucleotide adenylyltransferase PcnB [Spirochaetales bacterium]|nr:polynucleotide adenylyltransferase PcnB [Spirochaetales bacterium]